MFTQYAYYVRTYTIATECNGAQSPIQYFLTKPNSKLLFSNVGNLAIRSFSHVHSNIFPRCCCGTLVQDRK
jgi:hypothetical protein